MDCGENVDAALLRLPGEQLELLRRLRGAGKPVATFLIQGRPYEMEEIDACSDALFCCFYPGLTGGEAAAKLLFGDLTPAGRLPVSLPDRAGQLPVYYNYKDSYQGMRYYDAPRPRYPFGWGLTYTRFAYALASAPEEGDLSLAFTVRNAGERTACAVPQLYLHRSQGAATSRVRALCAFSKTELAPGQEKALRLDIPRESLTQWDARGRTILPPGKIQWFLRDGGEDLLQGEFFVKGAE